MIFGGKERPSPRDARDRLAHIVARHLADADEDTRRVVTAVAGLLARVAYADGHYAPEEEAALREELGRIRGLESPGVDAICELLADDIGQVALIGDHDWTRDLKALATRELRLEVLEVLLDLAVADGQLTQAETAQLRRVTTALGLTQAEYNERQARHRDKLAVLSG
jgi:uncharacterized tellurite resistance protein B-like protein